MFLCLARAASRRCCRLSHTVRLSRLRGPWSTSPDLRSSETSPGTGGRGGGWLVVDKNKKEASPLLPSVSLRARENGTPSNERRDNGAGRAPLSSLPATDDDARPPPTRQPIYMFYSSPHCAITIGSFGLSPFLSVATFSILRTTMSEAASRTFPNTTCFPSSHSVFLHVMKNWQPLVFGPEFAMERYPGPSCLKSKFSSSKRSPYIDILPVPSCFMKSPP
mmetsp:Transcript_4785/g.14215  ORF Transcript_4785/g.14215 Transcript_4785/m.14215 type:complete len:221 (+) Transcript_4785:82-744(+)